MEKVKIVILAGGQGARFWPLSRMKRPKQFLSISKSGESLIQATVRRVEPLAGKENIVIVTNILHEPLIREHVPFAKILSEPTARNTAAAIGLTAIHLAKEDPKTVMVNLPADHAVQSEEKLRETLSEAIQVASSNDFLVTVGIEPSRPDTAYGYIQRGDTVSGNCYRVKRFFEKPNLERAKKYLDAEDFYWNSGMFVWRADVFLQALEEFLPDMYSQLMRIAPVIGSDREQSVTEEIFEEIQGVSVDFGIMEHARNCVVVEARPFGWNDVGSWDAWAEHFEKDSDGNLLHGDALALESERNVLYSHDRLIAVVGAKDLVVIDSGDAVMVCPREKVQDVRKIVQELKKRERKDLV